MQQRFPATTLRPPENDMTGATITICRATCRVGRAISRKLAGRKGRKRLGRQWDLGIINDDNGEAPACSHAEAALTLACVTSRGRI
jgi:hypothetical protein